MTSKNHILCWNHRLSLSWTMNTFIISQNLKSRKNVSSEVKFVNVNCNRICCINDVLVTYGAMKQKTLIKLGAKHIKT